MDFDDISANGLNGVRNERLAFGSDLDDYLDHLDPGLQMYLCTRELKNLYTDFSKSYGWIDIFSK